MFKCRTGYLGLLCGSAPQGPDLPMTLPHTFDWSDCIRTRRSVLLGSCNQSGLELVLKNLIDVSSAPRSQTLHPSLHVSLKSVYINELKLPLPDLGIGVLSCVFALLLELWGVVALCRHRGHDRPVLWPPSPCPQVCIQQCCRDFGPRVRSSTSDQNVINLTFCPGFARMLVCVFAGLRLECIQGPKVKLLEHLLKNMRICCLSSISFAKDSRSSARGSELQTSVKVTCHYEGVPTGADGDGLLQSFPNLTAQSESLFGAVINFLINVYEVMGAVMLVRFDKQQPTRDKDFTANAGLWKAAFGEQNHNS